jgi:hypothetical protein
MALTGAIIISPAASQEKVDFTVSGSKWRCETECPPGANERLVMVEQKGSVVTFTGANGAVVVGAASTIVDKQSGPSLKCQMNANFCGPADKAVRTTYHRKIEIPEWKCVVSVQGKDGEPNTPPPFKARWMRFLSPSCLLGQSIWTTLTEGEVKALRRRCGEWNANC